MTIWRCEPCKFEGEAEHFTTATAQLTPEPHSKASHGKSVRVACPRCRGFVRVATKPSPIDQESFALYRARQALAAHLAQLPARIASQKAVDAVQAEHDARFLDSALHEIYGAEPPQQRDGTDGERPRPDGHQSGVRST